MNAPAIEASARRQSLDWYRLRSLFAGSGFLLALTTFVNVTWYAQSVFAGLAQGFLQSVQAALPVAALSAFQSIVPEPIAAVILNLAPSTGRGRIPYFIAAYLWLMAWCVYWDPAGTFSSTWTGGLVFDHPQYWAGMAESSISAILILLAFTYYRAASRASDKLLQSEIDAWTVDAEVQRAHLQVLRAQVEPHFLFNTLANVRTLARRERMAAVELIDNLVHYLSAALPKLRQEECSLHDEMQLIDSYLGIYHVRMGWRLSHQVVLPPELETLRVPTMIVLTLVENALKHGVSHAVEGGSIQVSASRELDTLVVKVADSGAGMSTQHGDGTGLSSTRMRLLMHYGEEASLSLARRSPSGTVATLRIPVSA